LGGRLYQELQRFLSFLEGKSLGPLIKACDLSKRSWENQDIAVTSEWYASILKEKIGAINWDEARSDVARFLKPREAVALDVWSREFFLSRVDKLEMYLKN
jgi:hypothetical protein